MSYINKIKKDGDIYDIRDSRVDRLSTTNETIVSYYEMKTLLERLASDDPDDEWENHTYTAYLSSNMMTELWESIDAEAVEKFISGFANAGATGTWFMTINGMPVVATDNGFEALNTIGEIIFGLTIETDTDTETGGKKVVVMPDMAKCIKLSITTFDSSLWNEE